MCRSLKSAMNLIRFSKMSRTGPATQTMMIHRILSKVVESDHFKALHPAAIRRKSCMIGANRNVKATVLVVRLREEICHTQHKQHISPAERTGGNGRPCRRCHPESKSRHSSRPSRPGLYRKRPGSGRHKPDRRKPWRSGIRFTADRNHGYYKTPGNFGGEQ